MRAELPDAQLDLRELAECAVVVLINGVTPRARAKWSICSASGWTRHLVIRAFDSPSDEARQRPPMWRFWRQFAAQGAHRHFVWQLVSRAIQRRPRVR